MVLVNAVAFNSTNNFNYTWCLWIRVHVSISTYTYASTDLCARLTSHCLLRRVNNVGVAAMHDEFCLECWHDRKAASSRRYARGVRRGICLRLRGSRTGGVCFDERRRKSDSEWGKRGWETGIGIIRQPGEAELPSIMTQSPTGSLVPPSRLPLVTPLRTYYPLTTVFK